MTGGLTNNGLMKVYHGSDTKITIIDLSKCELHKDFGQGFYVTNNLEHAKIWAKTKADWHNASPYVNEFEFMRSAFSNKEYKTLQFNSYSSEWLDFVIKNRDISTNEKQHDFDIVEGPIANDKVQRQLKSFFAKRITKEELLENLKYHEPTHQICFCSIKSLLTLKIIDRENTLIKSEDIIKEIAEELVKEQNISDIEAYKLIYESSIIDELFDENTKLYEKPWQEIYEMLKQEIEKNK
jgi:hypothetical protein